MELDVQWSVRPFTSHYGQVGLKKPKQDSMNDPAPVRAHLFGGIS